METEPLILSIITGLCVGGACWASTGAFHRFLDYVEADLADRLRSLRFVSKKLRWWIQMWLVIVVITLLVLWIGLDILPLAILLAVFMCAGPWLLIRKLSQARKQKIEEQLADAMVMFSSGVRAGLSLAQSLELLASDCPAPIQQEFSQIVGEYKMGKPLERTVSEAKDRLRSENFILFAAALLASRESGGRLNETVERISKSVLELQRLERKLKAETAQARKSALYMALAPVGILAAYAFMDYEAVEMLFTEIPGQMMLAVSVVLNIAAYFWALKILHADI